MFTRRPLFALAAAAAALTGAGITAATAAADGVHHPACVTVYKDLPHTADTPVAGDVWIKSGPNHFAYGYHAAGWDVPAQIDTDPSDDVKMQDTSHYDVCTSDTPTTTTEPPSTTTDPPSTTQPPTTSTEPPVVTDPPVTTTEPPATDPTTPDTTVPATDPTAPPATDIGDPPTATPTIDFAPISVCGSFVVTATNPTDEPLELAVSIDGALYNTAQLDPGDTNGGMWGKAPSDNHEHTVTATLGGVSHTWTLYASTCEVPAPPAPTPAPTGEVASDIVTPAPAPEIAGALPETL